MVFLCMSNLKNNNQINNNNTENPEITLNLILWMPLAYVLVEQSRKIFIIFLNLLSSQEAGSLCPSGGHFPDSNDETCQGHAPGVSEAREMDLQHLSLYVSHKGSLDWYFMMAAFPGSF